MLQAGIPHGEVAFTLVAVSIAFSIAAHSSSDVPIARMFDVEDMVGVAVGPTGADDTGTDGAKDFVDADPPGPRPAVPVQARGNENDVVDADWEHGRGTAAETRRFPGEVCLVQGVGDRTLHLGVGAIIAASPTAKRASRPITERRRICRRELLARHGVKRDLTD